MLLPTPIESISPPLLREAPARVHTVAGLGRRAAEDDGRENEESSQQPAARDKRALRRPGGVGASLRNLGRGITATHVAESHLTDLIEQVMRMRVVAVQAKTLAHRPGALTPLATQLSQARRRAASIAESAVFQRHALLGRRQPCMRLLVEGEEIDLAFRDASARGLGLEGPWGIEDPRAVTLRVDLALDRLRRTIGKARQQRVELAKRALALVDATPGELGGALSWVAEAAHRAMADATAAVASSHHQRPGLALQLLAG